MSIDDDLDNYRNDSPCNCRNDDQSTGFEAGTEQVEHDVVFNLPPVRREEVTLNIVEVRRGKPRFIVDDCYLDKDSDKEKSENYDAKV